MKTIVISAVNLTEGGTLTILRMLLESVVTSELCNQYRIIAIVNDKSKVFFNQIEYLEYPKSKKRWIYRLFYEYVYFRKISNQYSPYLWFSLHDITPNVKAKIKVVYLHNPSPFFKWHFKDLIYSTDYVLFALFYKWLYLINIHKNDYVIVQQNWLKRAFGRMFKLESNKIIVARPKYVDLSFVSKASIKENKENHYTFFFPSIARPFKNFEIICKSVLLLNKNNISNFNVILTIDGSENAYSRDIVKKYKHLNNVSFIGFLDKNQMKEMYTKTDALIFPSKLETWGLPISEFMSFNKPMILADLEYAHETSSGSKCTAFFNPQNESQLASLMKNLIDKDFSCFREVSKMPSSGVVVDNFQDLMDVLLKKY